MLVTCQMRMFRSSFVEERMIRSVTEARVWRMPLEAYMARKKALGVPRLPSSRTRSSCSDPPLENITVLLSDSTHQRPIPRKS